MPGQGRTIGIIMIAVALIVCLIATALLLAQVSAKETTVTGAILGILLVRSCLCCPLAAAVSIC